MERNLREEFFNAMISLKRSKIFLPTGSTLTGGEFHILKCLQMMEKNEGMTEITVTDLKNHGEQTMPAISQMLGGLENKKLVKRNVSRSDRRKIIVKLTSAGRKLIFEADKKLDAVWGRIFHELGESDMEQLIRIYGKILDIARIIQDEEAEKNND